MDRQLRQLLPSALGESQFVVAANVDIRGFSSFSQRVESVEAAVFLRRAYVKLAEDYFPAATFFKLTGDGMLLVFAYADDESLKSIVANLFDAAFRILPEFGHITQGDSMVNFKVPDKVGIGIARGAASRIYSGDVTLDYSGRVLNLASRLMNLARPSGIVVDEAFGPELIPDQYVAQLTSQDVYLNGIAEADPIAVLYTVAETVIPASALVPILQPSWETVRWVYKYRALLNAGKTYRHVLQTAPADANGISIRVSHPVRRRGPKAVATTGFAFRGFAYELKAGEHILLLDLDTLRELVGAPPKPYLDDEIVIEARYPLSR